MTNCVMKKIMSDKEYFWKEIQAVKETPVQENAFNKVIKKGLGQN